MGGYAADGHAALMRQPGGEKMENNFTKTIKDFLINELEEKKDYLEESESVYISDLAFELTEMININGSVHCSRYAAIEFIKENWDDFENLVDYYEEIFGETLNPFSNPERAEVIAYIEGVNYLLGELICLKKYEDGEIKLTETLINEMIKELEENRFEIEF